MKILDSFCCAGGASCGNAHEWILKAEIIGVDYTIHSRITPLPLYKRSWDQYVA